MTQDKATEINEFKLLLRKDVARQRDKSLQKGTYKLINRLQLYWNQSLEKAFTNHNNWMLHYFMHFFFLFPFCVCVCARVLKVYRFIILFSLVWMKYYPIHKIHYWLVFVFVLSYETNSPWPCPTIKRVNTVSKKEWMLLLQASPATWQRTRF